MPLLTTQERIGTTLAEKYTIVRVIGEGGMGVVFEGRHAFTNRRVAIKLLHPHLAREDAVVQRFFREARAATSLKHPHVVDVLDMGRDADDSVYLVLEYLAGESLSAYFRRLGPLDPARAASVLLPVMAALETAHARGIIHRDLKPENIYIARADASAEAVPKLLDFGIAKIDDGGAKATRTGQAIGTPAYMAPEQATNAAHVDAQADIWSMGVVWYEALSGELPFNATSSIAMLGQLLLRPPRPLTDASPEVPPALARVVMRALERDLAARWPSIGAFGAAIEACTGERSPIPFETTADPTPLSARDSARDMGEATTLADSSPPRPPGSIEPSAAGPAPPPRGFATTTFGRHRWAWSGVALAALAVGVVGGATILRPARGAGADAGAAPPAPRVRAPVVAAPEPAAPPSDPARDRADAATVAADPDRVDASARRPLAHGASREAVRLRGTRASAVTATPEQAPAPASPTPPEEAPAPPSPTPRVRVMNW